MKRLRFIVLICLSCLTARAETGAYVYEFLRLPVATVAAGLGGNTVASPEADPDLFYHNPALLTPDQTGTLSLGYMNYVADIHFGHAAYSRRINDHSAWTAGARYLDYGQIEGYDHHNVSLGQVHAKDMAFTGGYAFLLNDSWRGGINAHLVYSLLDEYTSVGMAVDLGVYYMKPENGLWAGLSIKSLGSQFSAYDEHYEALPWDVQIGLSKQLEHAPFRLSLTAQGFDRWTSSHYDNDSRSRIKEEKPVRQVLSHLLLGVELLPGDNFHLALGYNPGRRYELAIEQRSMLSGFSAAFSFQVKKMRLGASYAKYHQSGNSLQMNFSTQLPTK